MTTGAVTTCYSIRIVIGLQKNQLRLLLLQHLDHTREILTAMPRNAVRRIDCARHAAQRSAGFDGGGVFLTRGRRLRRNGVMISSLDSSIVPNLMLAMTKSTTGITTARGLQSINE